jgi:drug/metabolite transporter (DMT)-like permease
MNNKLYPVFYGLSTALPFLISYLIEYYIESSDPLRILAAGLACFGWIWLVLSGLGLFMASKIGNETTK